MKRPIKNNVQVVDDGLRCLWNPDTKSVESCVEYGRRLGELLK
jgi:hypothetical protein